MAPTNVMATPTTQPRHHQRPVASVEVTQLTNQMGNTSTLLHYTPPPLQISNTGTSPPTHCCRGPPHNYLPYSRHNPAGHSHSQQRPLLQHLSLRYRRPDKSFVGISVSEYLITRKDIAPIYMSPCPYFDSFEEELNLRKFNLTKHRTAGLCLTQVDGRLILGGMASSTLGTKIPRWHTRLKGAWLIKIGDLTVHTIADAQALGVHPSHYLTFFSPRDSTCNDARRPPYQVLCSIPSTCTRSDKSPLGLGHSRCSLGQGPTFLSCPRRQRHQLCNKGYETHTG